MALLFVHLDMDSWRTEAGHHSLKGWTNNRGRYPLGCLACVIAEKLETATVCYRAQLGFCCSGPRPAPGHSVPYTASV